MCDAPNGPGVYAIWNTATSKVYVGSAMSICSRWRGHRVKLKSGRHHNPHLQAAWNKYGPEVFELIILDECPSDQLLSREEYWIDLYCAADRDRGYNCQAVPGRSNLGRKWSQETKDKMSVGVRDYLSNPEHKDQMLARARDPETRRKNSQCRKEMWQDSEGRERYLAGHKKRVADPKFRANASAARLKRYADPETRARLREVARLPNRCRNVSEGMKKLWATPEHRSKMVEAQQRPEYQLRMKATKAARKQQRLREFRERLVAERRARGWVS